MELIPLVVALIALLGTSYAVWSNRRLSSDQYKTAQAGQREELTAAAYKQVYEDRVAEWKARCEREETLHAATKRKADKEISALRAEVKSLNDQLALRNGSL